MIILLNTDKSINVDKRRNNYFCKHIAEEMKRHASHITRIEVHLSDENGKKDGLNDKRCMMEARLEGRNPVAVTAKADTTEHAVAAAISKLKSSLETIIGRIQNH